MSNAAPRAYRRFDTSQTIQHIVLLTSFTVLAVTGLPQKFAAANWADALIAVLGGIETTRIIHRISAIVLLLVTVVHIVDAAYRLFVLGNRPHMLPTPQDVRDAWAALLYNLGLRKEHPRIGRFGFEEKAEYWALVWGLLVMVVTGFMMWNPITTTRFLPGVFIPAAKAAHGSEALLAVLAIIIWHFYNVHLKHFNTSIFTGKLTKEEMAEFHPQELADIEAGRVDRPPKPEIARRRQRVFVPIAGVLTAAWLVGVYLFATAEQTAITTVPRHEEAEIFVPLTPTPFAVPPTAQPLAVAEAGGEVTWADTIQPLLEERCGACHGGTAGLTLTDYDSALAGGDDGPVILPGDADGSLIIQKQEAGDHPGQLNDDEIGLLRQWIDAGAAGDGGAEAVAEEAGAEVTWADTIQPLLEERCGTCHGGTAGLTLTDYDSALAGGDDGPAILPGDADGSLIIQKQEAGDHPGQLDDDEIDLLRQWIDDGAAGDEGAEAEAAEVAWADSIQPLLEERCGACHGTTAGLTLTDYDSALAGGDSGPAITPGDAAGSLIVQKQEAGGHPGQLDDDEIDLLKQWIDGGAQEGADAGEEEVSWAEMVQPLFEERCGTCHGTTAGLTLTDYESALAGGDDGPVILPGDAAGSLLIQKQEAGDHPGQLDDDEIDVVRRWIDGGALDN